MEGGGEYTCVDVGGREHDIEMVEIKKIVSVTSLGFTIPRNARHMNLYEIKGRMEHKTMPREHILQFVQQILVTNTNLSI